MRAWTFGTILMLSIAVGGCSFSASSASISDSIAQSSKSVSDSISSSSPDGSSESEQAYREDVRDYTVAALKAGREGPAFESGLADVAEQHGITNWEADAATFVGIGEGLGRAGASPETARGFADEMGASSGRVPAGELIQKGYDATHS